MNVDCCQEICNTNFCVQGSSTLDITPIFHVFMYFKGTVTSDFGLSIMHNVFSWFIQAVMFANNLFNYLKYHSQASFELRRKMLVYPSLLLADWKCPANSRSIINYALESVSPSRSTCWVDPTIHTWLWECKMQRNKTECL